MKLTNILTIGSFVLFAAACGSSYDDYYYEDEYYADEAYYEDLSEEEIAQLEREMGTAYGEETPRFSERENNGMHNANFSSNGKVEMRPLVDSKTGQVTAYAPLPANWKLGQAWEGPGGVKVELRQGGSAMHQQRPIQSVDQLIQQTLMPELRKAGVQIDNILDLPGIARNNQKNYSQYWQAMPMQVTHQVKGIEMTDPNNGKKGMFILHLIISRSQYGSMNNYYMNVLEASPRQYEQAKKTLIHALENMQLDRQAVAAHNQREQQRSNASWAAHNQRMRQNQANFDSWQQTQKTYSDISDINHEGWKRRNAISDAGHDKSINGIWERDAAVNPYSGQQMNVETGYKYYYMNANGQYFGTNDEFYNPARDPRINSQEWRRVQRPSSNY